MENDEDREDDDQDDDTSKAPSKDKAEGTPGEENIDFISDYQKLEVEITPPPQNFLINMF